MGRSVGEELEAARVRLAEAGVESPLLDAQLMMAHSLEVPRLQVIAHPNQTLTRPELDIFSFMLEKRVSRKPLAYILGCKEFFGIELVISPGVLVPRPETELLVDQCLERLSGCPPKAAEIGTGSGAISVALALSVPAVVYATEISSKAMPVARRNVEKHQLAGRLKLLEGDMLKPLNDLGIEFDAIVSNPPYIPTRDMASLQPEIRLYEPVEALDGGEDGLDAYRRILPEAIGLLGKGGFTAVELGRGQAKAVSDIAKAARYRHVDVAKDLAGTKRVLVAYK